MEIDIKEYLSESEIKDIVIEELRGHIRNTIKDERTFTRILSNSAYRILQEQIEQEVPQHKDLIINKTVEIINAKDYDFHVFYHGYNGKSLAIEIVEQVVKNNKELINSSVVKSIKEYDYSAKILENLENGFAVIQELFMDLSAAKRKQDGTQYDWEK
jgi:IS605 OrfB family transposase